MTIVHRLLPDGAFVAGDTETGRTAIAFSQSQNAASALLDPASAAGKMIAEENAVKWRDHITGIAVADARNWRLLNGAKTED